MLNLRFSIQQESREEVLLVLVEIPPPLAFLHGVYVPTVCLDDDRRISPAGPVYALCFQRQLVPDACCLVAKEVVAPGSPLSLSLSSWPDKNLCLWAPGQGGSFRARIPSATARRFLF